MLHTATGDLLLEAITAIGNRELERAAPAIARLATSADAGRDVRIAAIDALPRVDLDSFDILDELTESHDPAIAEAAEAAMEELEINLAASGDVDEEEE